MKILRAGVKYVYLAGPIMGCTMGEANDWRRYVADALEPFNIIAISPLRCEPLIGEKYSANYPDPRFSTPRAISAKNRFDVTQSDLTFALLPKPIPTRVQSYGTLGEIFWADAYGRQVILCTNDPVIINHPVVDSAVDWKFTHVQPGDDALISDAAKREMIQMDSLPHCIDAAIETIIGVLGGYTGGKNV